MTMTLDSIVPWGRSLDEYQAMFALTEVDLAGNILGCGDGPASFNAELTRRGGHVISCDPIYAFTTGQIAERIDATADELIAQIKRNPHNYVWNQFGDPDRLVQHRLRTMDLFLADFAAGAATGRYQVAALPELAFADSAFDLALCSHLLFLYSEQLSWEFHLAALHELCRVAREVRIFPLLALDCRPSPHVAPALTALAAAGFDAKVVSVGYEFQTGGDHMLRIRPG